MFGSRSFPSRSRERVDDHPSIKLALDELDAWLADARPYDKKKHKSSWCSMSTDVRAALDTRGPQLTARTSALNELAELLKTPDLGDEKQPARGLCRQLRDQSRLELADEGVTVAACSAKISNGRVYAMGTLSRGGPYASSDGSRTGRAFTCTKVVNVLKEFGVKLYVER